MPSPRFHKLAGEKRVAILRVAAEEFAEHGFEGASYNRIIERTGLSKGALYYYFEDKRDLYLTLVKDVQETLLRRVESPPPARSADEFWEQVHTLRLRLIQTVVESPTLFALLRVYLKALSGGELAGPVAELRRADFGGWLDRLLSVGQELGAVRSDLPRTLIVDLLFAVDDVLLRTWTERLPIDLERITRKGTELIRRLAMPDPDSRDVLP